jgi:hypothetical protein
MGGIRWLGPRNLQYSLQDAALWAHRTQTYPAANLMRRFILSPMDAMIDLIFRRRLRCHISVWLAWHLVARLRITFISRRGHVHQCRLGIDGEAFVLGVQHLFGLPFTAAPFHKSHWQSFVPRTQFEPTTTARHQAGYFASRGLHQANVYSNSMPNGFEIVV